MTDSVRKQILDAFEAALAAGVSAPVEANRDIEVDTFDYVVLRDGGQEPHHENTGQTDYEMTVDVEGYATAATPAGLRAAMDALYGEIVAAALTDVTLGGLAIDITEGRMEDPLVGRAPGQGPTISFSLAFVIAFQTAEADPAVPAP